MELIFYIATKIRCDVSTNPIFVYIPPCININ